MSTRHDSVRGSAIARSTVDSIEVHGLDLCSQLIGHVTLADFLVLELKGVLPDPAERDLVDAFLVTLAEHGTTPSTIAARMTLLGSPDQLQAAVAAGLLGAGSRFLGSMGDCARLLQDPAVDGAGDDPRARASVLLQNSRGAVLPGLGHPLHKDGDPRSARLFAMARAAGSYGRACDTIHAVVDALAKERRAPLPINATGAIAAIATDLGYPWSQLRAFPLVARTVGLIGHMVEEMRAPIAQSIWDAVESAPAPVEVR